MNFKRRQKALGTKLSTRHVKIEVVALATIVALMLLHWCCCIGIIALVLLHWCCCIGVVALVLLQWCYCIGVVAVVLLHWCYCIGVVALMLLHWCCCIDVVALVLFSRRTTKTKLLFWFCFVKTNQGPVQLNFYLCNLQNFNNFFKNLLQNLVLM